MNEKLVEQITHALTAGGNYAGCEDLVSFVVKDTLQWLKETQIVTYTFDDPEGGNFPYSNLDELVMDLGMWAEEYPVSWPIQMQVEFREPAYFLRFTDHQPELLQ